LGPNTGGEEALRQAGLGVGCRRVSPQRWVVFDSELSFVSHCKEKISKTYYAGEKFYIFKIEGIWYNLKLVNRRCGNIFVHK